MTNDRFPLRNPCDRVLVIRHTYDEFEVVAFDLLSREFRRRWFRFGANRKSVAIRYAYWLAARHYLFFAGDVLGYSIDQRFELVEGETRDEVIQCGF